MFTELRGSRLVSQCRVPRYGVHRRQEAGRQDVSTSPSPPGRRGPQVVSQRYLGSAEEIAARLSKAGPGGPDRRRHLASATSLRCGRSFTSSRWRRSSTGSPAPIAPVPGRRSGPTSPSRRRTSGRSVSKLAFSGWWQKTTAERWLRLPAGAHGHQRFWTRWNRSAGADPGDRAPHRGQDSRGPSR